MPDYMEVVMNGIKAKAKKLQKEVDKLDYLLKKQRPAQNYRKEVAAGDYIFMFRTEDAIWGPIACRHKNSANKSEYMNSVEYYLKNCIESGHCRNSDVPSPEVLSKDVEWLQALEEALQSFRAQLEEDMAKAWEEVKHTVEQAETWLIEEKLSN